MTHTNFLERWADKDGFACLPGTDSGDVKATEALSMLIMFAQHSRLVEQNQSTAYPERVGLDYVGHPR